MRVPEVTPAVSDIPVIFLSALSDTNDKVKAFRSGAVDYISKPFQFEEVHARVETHLKLHELQRALKLQNEHLEEAIAARTRELAQANARLTILDRSKNEFLNLISHEFRTPLNGLLGVSEIILEGMPPTDENKDLLEIFEQSRLRILSILDDALLLAEIDIKGEQFKSTAISLSAVLSRAMEGAIDFAKARRVAFGPLPPHAGLVAGNGDLLVRALRTLLETAVKFSAKGETVRVACDIVLGSPRIVIESHGRTIPGSALEKFFDIFSIGEAATPGGDIGLGPPVAMRILSLFGASVKVANRDTSGIRLTVLLEGC